MLLLPYKPFFLSEALTCFFDGCAFLVHGSAQSGCADIQHADLVHTGVKHPQRVFFLLVVVTEDLAVDEGGKHLGLQEAGQEGQVGFWLVRQEGRLCTRKKFEFKNNVIMLEYTELKCRI